MSANLDLVQSMYSAWESGDYSSADWADPEIEFVIADGPSPGTWTGVAGMAQGWRTWLSAWEEFHQQADEFHELDDERVLVLVRFSGRGKTSGLKLEQLEQLGARAAAVCYVRGGKVTRFVAYIDHKRGLADLGVASESGSSRW
jgi:ketosteroid isomerase-like protein